MCRALRVVMSARSTPENLMETQNTNWLDNANDNFDQAIAEEDWGLAQAVIDDIRGNGFEFAANTLRKALFAAQKKFADLKDEAMRLAGGPDLNTISQDKDELYQERKQENDQWLLEHLLTEDDVMEDEQGMYVLLDDENGLQKTYLPFASKIDFTF